MEINLSGKHALLAGTLNQTLVAAGKALHEAGAVLLVHKDSPVWGDLPHIISPSPESIDIVVINAGWRHFAGFLDSTPDDWDAALSANFEIPLYVAQAAAKTMITHQTTGRIIFLSGIESVMPFAGTSVAGTSLTMLSGLARMMAVDLGAYGITVNVLAAGWTHTERYAALATPAQQHIVNGIPLGRVAAPDELGATVVMLASDMAGYITGTILPVDGGYGLTRSDGNSMLESSS